MDLPNLRLIEVQLSRAKLQILYWHGVDEPDAIIGEEEGMASAMHAIGSDRQYNWLSATLAYLFGRGLVGRKMNVAAISLDETATSDRLEELRDSPVK